MTTPNSRSIPELVSDAFGQLAKLVANEFDLVKAEFSQKAAQVGRAGALIGAGAVFFMPALLLILLAVAAALVSAGLSQAMAYLLTGIGTAALGGILIAVGVSRLSGDALKPNVTIDQLQRDKIAAKEMVT